MPLARFRLISLLMLRLIFFDYRREDTIAEVATAFAGARYGRRRVCAAAGDE